MLSGGTYFKVVCYIYLVMSITLCSSMTFFYLVSISRWTNLGTSLLTLNEHSISTSNSTANSWTSFLYLALTFSIKQFSSWKKKTKENTTKLCLLSQNTFFSLILKLPPPWLSRHCIMMLLLSVLPLFAHLFSAALSLVLGPMFFSCEKKKKAI